MRVFKKLILLLGEKVVILRVMTSSLVAKLAISAVFGSTPLGDWEIYELG